MSRLAIIHYSPLELYPPVQNLLRILEKEGSFKRLYVFTTENNIPELSRFGTEDQRIKIIRLSKSRQERNKCYRLLGYLQFNFSCFFQLIINRPGKILYYETLSSFPVYLYRYFLNKHVKIFIHYHEYTTPSEYQSGMKLSRFLHRLEKWLYPRATWVSHTNPHRLSEFEKDIFPVRISNPQVLPNYPPYSWYKIPAAVIPNPVKIIYVGALSLDTMYTREFANWVNLQSGKVTWDIYSYNVAADAKAFFKLLNSDYIQLQQGVNYDELPHILAKYNVGVILYTGHIPNYIYNAPNKLFEYLICGLDVWYPEIMKGVHEYQTKESYPKVVSINFELLNKFNLEYAMRKTGSTLNNNTFYCENVYKSFTRQLTNNN